MSNWVISNWIKRRKWLLVSTILVAVLVSLLGVQVIDKQDSVDRSVKIGVSNEKVITIGHIAYAAGSVDYTYDGVDDDVQFQAALNALPITGGRIVDVSAVQKNFSATVTRAIPNVTIIGSGQGSYFVNDGGTALFTAGGNSWVFQDLRTDAGSINMGATTGWIWGNVTVGATHYDYRNPTNSVIGGALVVQSLSGSGAAITSVDAETVNGYNAVRSATYVIAASDATAAEKAQADALLDGVDDYVQIQVAIDVIEAQGSGTIRIIGKTVNLGTTGVTAYRTNDVIIDFRGVTINYSGVGAAISLIEDRAATQTIRNQVLGGSVVATGGAVGSATAVGIKTQQLQFSIIDVYVENFQAGDAIQIRSGAASGDFSENNRINAYVYQCKNGVHLTGDGGTGYNRIEFLSYDNYVSTAATGILTDDTIGSQGLSMGCITMWAHTNNMTGIDLTNTSSWNIDHLRYESVNTTIGFVGLRTRTLSQRGHIGMFGGGFFGTAFDLAGGTLGDNTITIDGFDFSCCNPNLVGISMGVSGVQVVNNPDFTANVNGYSASGGTLAWEAAGGHRDDGNLSFINAAADTYDWIFGDTTYKYPVQPGSTIWIDVFAKTDLDDTQIEAGLFLFDDAAAPISDWYQGLYILKAEPTWSRLVYQFQLPDNVRYVNWGLLTKKPDNTSKLYLDDFRVYMTTPLGLEAHGIGQIPSGSSSAVITHGLAYTPAHVLVTPKSDPGVLINWFTSAIGATQFTVNSTSAVVNNWDFEWYAQVNN